MTADAAGNDLGAVFVPVTGFLGYAPQGVAVPTPMELANPAFQLPTGVRKVGLIKQDGGFEWSAEASGDALEFWQDGYKLPSGLVDATLATTLAQTDPIVRELIWGKTPDQYGVIDVELASNTNVYFLVTEEVAKNGIIRRRIAPNCTVQTVKEDKSERGTVQGYAVTFATQRSAEINNAHFREAVLIPGNVAAPTGVTPGTPGEFIPATAVPANITTLRSIGALGQTAAWTTGQYVVLGNAAEVSWDGADWKTGRAA